MPPLLFGATNVTANNLEAILATLGLYGSAEDSLFRSKAADVAAISVDVCYIPCYMGNVVGSGTQSITVDSINLVPFFVPKDIHVDRIAFVISTGGGAGAKARVGIYNATQVAPFVPTTLIVDGGEFDATLVNGKITTVDFVLQGGKLYFAAILTGTNAPTVRSGGSQAEPLLGHQILAAAATATPILGIRFAQAYGALPALLPATIASYTISGNDPLVFIRVN